jgi:hypothetical protein
VATVKLDIDSPRPVASAAEQVERAFGVVVTYEDPAYSPDEVVADEAGRLIPRGGQLTLETEGSLALGDVLERILALAEATNNRWRFALEHRAPLYHIIPRSDGNESGTLRPYRSVLDVRIPLPATPANGLEHLEAICRAVGAATNQTILPGTIPVNALLRHQMAERPPESPPEETARDALSRMLAEMGSRWSWQLLNDPSSGTFVLNVHGVEGQPSSPS